MDLVVAPTPVQRLHLVQYPLRSAQYPYDATMPLTARVKTTQAHV